MGQQKRELEEHMAKPVTKQMSFWGGTLIVLLAHVGLAFLLFLFIGA